MMFFKIVIGILILCGLAALSIFGITKLLEVDDIAGCSGPDEALAACAPADAIVAISGGDTVARTQEAVNLYNQGWAPILVLSGAAQDPASPSNAEAMRQQALQAGVPPKALMLDHNSFNTEANASFAKQLVPGAKRVIVVTSPYHQRRATIEFSRAFGAEATVLAHPTPHDRAWGPYWWLTPLGWWLAISEVIKTTYVMTTK